MPTRSVFSEIRGLQKRGKKIVFTNGCFDLVHAGHVRLLMQAKRLGDVLVVGLNSDASVRRLKGRARPVLPLRDRIEVLAALRCVDFVIPFSEDTPRRLIEKVCPDVLIKGGDWNRGNVVGGDFVRRSGGRVVPGLYVKGKSTSAIISKIRGSTGG